MHVYIALNTHVIKFLIELNTRDSIFFSDFGVIFRLHDECTCFVLPKTSSSFRVAHLFDCLSKFHRLQPLNTNCM